MNLSYEPQRHSEINLASIHIEGSTVTNGRPSFRKHMRSAKVLSRGRNRAGVYSLILFFFFLEIYILFILFFFISVFDSLNFLNISIVLCMCVRQAMIIVLNYTALVFETVTSWGRSFKQLKMKDCVKFYINSEDIFSCYMTSLILPVGILKDSKIYGHFKHLQHSLIYA